MKVSSLPKLKLNPERDVIGVACYRSRRGAEVAARLSAAAGANAEMQAEADMIRVAADVSNAWHATNLHNADGDAYDGAGVLWQCGSRLCPSYMKASRARARARVRVAMEGVRLVGSERWRMMTLTMPTLGGRSLSETLEVFGIAWKLLRKRGWWRANVRAGVKGEEFTLGDSKRLKRERREWDAERDGYHVHAHVLAVSNWIEWARLGEEWTSCLEQAARRAGVALQIGTAHGRAVVDVRLVVARVGGKVRGVITEAGAVEEVCKYITKAESWLKLPDHQLCEVARTLRGRRMVEMVGECNQRHGSERGRQRQTPEEREATAAARSRAEFVERERVRQSQWLDDDPRADGRASSLVTIDADGRDDDDWWKWTPATADALAYLDTQKTIDGEQASDSRAGRVLWKRRYRKPLRLIGAELIAAGEREKWLELLTTYVAGVQDYRRGALSWRYPQATFSALDGRTWYGMRANPATARN